MMGAKLGGAERYHWFDPHGREFKLTLGTNSTIIVL
jgi:hypothetical protein